MLLMKHDGLILLSRLFFGPRLNVFTTFMSSPEAFELSQFFSEIQHVKTSTSANIPIAYYNNCCLYFFSPPISDKRRL